MTRYANEALIVWYVVMATYIVLTNPEAHTEFILINVGVFALYQWLQEKEHDRLSKAIRRKPG